MHLYFNSTKSDITLNLKHVELGKLTSVFSLNIFKELQHLFPTSPAKRKGYFVPRQLLNFECCSISNFSYLVFLYVFLFHCHSTTYLQKLMHQDYCGEVLDHAELFRMTQPLLCIRFPLSTTSLQLFATVLGPSSWFAVHRFCPGLILLQSQKR